MTSKAPKALYTTTLQTVHCISEKNTVGLQLDNSEKKCS